MPYVISPCTVSVHYGPGKRTVLTHHSNILTGALTVLLQAGRPGVTQVRLTRTP